TPVPVLGWRAWRGRPVLLSSDAPRTELYTLSLHAALPIFGHRVRERHADLDRVGDLGDRAQVVEESAGRREAPGHECDERRAVRSEEHTSELQSRENLVCRLLLEKKKARPVPDLYLSSGIR